MAGAPQRSVAGHREEARFEIGNRQVEVVGAARKGEALDRPGW